MKLILDFDDVLFNTSKLKEKFFAVLDQNGITNAREQYQFERKDDRPFSLWFFLKRICEKEHIPDAGLLYEEIMSVCEECLNGEMIEIVKKVGHSNCYIVTNGEEEFQKDKIVRSGVYPLVQEVIIVPGSKKEEIEALCKKFEGEVVVFVDDKKKFIDDIDMEAVSNLKTITFNENGLSNLRAEIKANPESEIQRNGPSQDGPSFGPTMR